MFLLNIRTRRLESFLNDLQIPNYYILSHVWGEDEVTYQDVRGSDPEALADRRGWQKIEGFCDMLLGSKDWLQSQNGFKRSVAYVWVDTCCINKESSAELSEAINSMYAWYSKAVACIAYLEDVPTPTTRDLRASRWFTRGWTLQELLSPDEVHFYTASWEPIGDRFGLAGVICERTGIHPKFLERDEIWQASIAEKMSWAAKRKTTRSEDLAYCLMGLFGINMPLLYGEGGENAFIRLQEEILKESTDESIFAWDATGEPDGAGMLATHPSRFHSGASVIPLNTRKNPEAVKNGGIIMNAGCVKTSQPDLWNVVLDCTLEGAPANKRISVQVAKGPDCIRTPMPFSMTSRRSNPEQLFFLKRRLPPPSSRDLHICEVSWNSQSFSVMEAWPGTCWTNDSSSTEHRSTLQDKRQDGRSRYSLGVRRAWRMAMDAGIAECGKLVAALALSVKSAPEEIFVLGITFAYPNGKYALTLMKLRDAVLPGGPSSFQFSRHWPVVSGLIEAWATEKAIFDGSDSPVIDTSSRRVAVQSAHKTIDRRNGLVISLTDRSLQDAASDDQLLVDDDCRLDIIDPSLIGFEHMKSVPDFEYWKPYYRRTPSLDSDGVSEVSAQQGSAVGNFWMRIAQQYSSSPSPPLSRVSSNSKHSGKDLGGISREHIGPVMIGHHSVEGIL